MFNQEYIGRKILFTPEGGGTQRTGFILFTGRKSKITNTTSSSSTTGNDGSGSVNMVTSKTEQTIEYYDVMYCIDEAESFPKPIYVALPADIKLRNKLPINKSFTGALR